MNCLKKDNVNMIINTLFVIDENLGYDVRIKSLCNLYNISPWHFQRIFKMVTGKPIGSYIRQRRLYISAIKLLETELSVTEIAFSVGYNSHQAFSRSFKKSFNITPKDFRNKKVNILHFKKLLKCIEESNLNDFNIQNEYYDVYLHLKHNLSLSI